jgi:predicted nucleic acid-binding protein
MPAITSVSQEGYGGRSVSVYLDTNIVYLVEQHPAWAPRVASKLKTVRAASERLAMSDLTRMECQVGPLSKGDQALLDDFGRFFGSPEVQIVPITSAVWDRAAAIRAKHKLKPLDSVHLAAAVEGGCHLFLTNDAGLRNFTDIPVEVLS